MERERMDSAETLARLSAATIFELRGEWRRLHRAPPPMRLSRDLLMRGITYKLQERPRGGLSSSILRKLERLNRDTKASDGQRPAPPISLKAGTRACARLARRHPCRAGPGARARMERPALSDPPQC